MFYTKQRRISSKNFRLSLFHVKYRGLLFFLYEGDFDHDCHPRKRRKRRASHHPE